jgi:hypothetical protein
VKTLKVDLFLRDGDDDVFDDEDDDSDSNEEEDERYARLARGIAPKMEVLLRPVVPVVEITDQDEYLMSRGL